MKVNVTVCWHGVRFLSKTSYQAHTGNFPLQLTGSENNSVRPHQTVVRTLPRLWKSTAICIKLISDVDRNQWKTSRERTEGVIVITKERWGNQTTPGTEGGLDEWNWGEHLTADESGRLQGGCLVHAPDFSAFFFPLLSQLQQAFLRSAFQENLLAPHLCILTEILHTQSHLSSRRQPLHTLLRHHHLRNGSI